MEWRDEAIVLSMRKHGETSVIAELLTKAHGRHLGVIRGGTSRKLAPHLQPGTGLSVTWRARLGEHLGQFTVEPLRARSGVLSDRLSLAGLNAICGLLAFSLPEREDRARLYTLSCALLDAVDAGEDWPLDYLHWEVLMLEELGYRLDLGACAVTGTREGLAFVSPRTGRAVSRDAAGEWAARLLPLPACLVSDTGASLSELLDGLTTTGYFLENWLAPALGDRPVPAARQRLIDVLSRQTGPA